MTTPPKTKCGYVSIIGRPNVGKSTLLNRLVGLKIAGVSPKPQTTRNLVRGILTRPEGQIVFVDTPGLHKPHDLLGEWMVHEVAKSLEEIDLLYWMVMPGDLHPEDAKILEMVKKITKPVFLLINQTDRFPKPALLPVLEHYSKEFNFQELIPVSAKQGDQMDVLIRKSFENLPEGPPLFPEDQISDQSERFIVAEILREKLFICTGEEIPYATAVEIETFQEREDGLINIEATILVERDSQKAIVIGKGGAKLKEIGRFARVEMERFLERKVFLKTWVKTLPNWKKDPAALRRLGYQ